MRRIHLVYSLVLFFLLLLPLPALAVDTYVKGQKVVLSAKVVDENGSPVQGVVVNFEDETDGVLLGSDTTDSSGVASISWDTSSASVGLHTIHVWVSETPSLYVEAAETYYHVQIVEPASLRVSYSSPSAVRPGEEFTVEVTVSNEGGAAIEGLTVQLGSSAKYVGTLPGGQSKTVTFTFTAPDDPGAYTLRGSVRGREQYTGRLVEEAISIGYEVKTVGFSVSISAPESVESGAEFAFTVTLSSVDEDPLDVTLEITITGATPTGFTRRVYLAPRATEEVTFNATAGSSGQITIVAVGRAMDMVEEDTATINVVTRVRSSAITLEVPPRVDPSATFTASGKLVDGETGDGLSGRRVLIEFNGNATYVTTKGDGTFSVELVAPSEAGSYNIKASWSGDEEYSSASVSRVVLVGLKEAVLELRDVAVNVSQEFCLEGRLTSLDGGLAGRKVNVTFEGVGREAVTSQDGGFEACGFIAPETPGQYVARASFQGDEVYGPALAQATVNVTIPKTTSLSEKPLELEAAVYPNPASPGEDVVAQASANSDDALVTITFDWCDCSASGNGSVRKVIPAPPQEGKYVIKFTATEGGQVVRKEVVLTVVEPGEQEGVGNATGRRKPSLDDFIDVRGNNLTVDLAFLVKSGFEGCDVVLDVVYPNGTVEVLKFRISKDRDTVTLTLPDGTRVDVSIVCGSNVYRVGTVTIGSIKAGGIKSAPVLLAQVVRNFGVPILAVVFVALLRRRIPTDQP